MKKFAAWVCVLLAFVLSLPGFVLGFVWESTAVGWRKAGKTIDAAISTVERKR